MAGPNPHRPLWGLLAWLALEGGLHGWASGVNGQMPATMVMAFSLGRSVLAHGWWRADRQRVGAPARLWLSGVVIALPWLGSTLHLLLTRRGRERWRALRNLALLLLALACAYLIPGGLMAYMLGGM